MLFNSLAFAVFLPVVFAVYWSLQKTPLRYQNLFLLLASYVFYGWWDVRFLLLLFVSSLCDYLVGMFMTGTASHRRKRSLLIVSLAVNLALLGFFKYCNFFIESASTLLRDLGLGHGTRTLRIILPVGISFYTFQTLSYTIDVYRGKVRPTRDFISFFSFVSFFPQLVAGPVERAKNLLPQFYVRRTFDPRRASDGMRQMLWGLIKKMVVADNVGTLVDYVFANPGDMGWQCLLIGGALFSVQIYCDFSGYTDIAIGSARLFGFDLMTNFAYPYFSRNLAEFWSRWNISISSWFREYVYIPLGGSRVGPVRHAVNLVLTFTISGLWHGAYWTFLLWGFLHGLFYVLTMVTGHTRRYEGPVAPGRVLPSLREALCILLTLIPVVLTAVIFRTRTMRDAAAFMQGLLILRSGTWPGIGFFLQGLTFTGVLFLVEWLQRRRAHGLEISRLPRALRWAVYYALITVLILFGSFTEHAFIYFQF